MVYEEIVNVLLATLVRSERLRVVRNRMIGPSLEAYVRDADGRNFHWDTLMTLSQSEATVWEAFLGGSVAPGRDLGVASEGEDPSAALDRIDPVQLGAPGAHWRTVAARIFADMGAALEGGVPPTKVAAACFAVGEALTDPDRLPEIRQRLQRRFTPSPGSP